MNEKLIREVVAKIRAEVAAGTGGWDQRLWIGGGNGGCGTTACFAGWALRLSGYGTDYVTRPGGLLDGEDWDEWFFIGEGGTPVYSADAVAGELLGLDVDDAEEIFYFMPHHHIANAYADGAQEEMLALMVARVEQVTGLTGL